MKSAAILLFCITLHSAVFAEAVKDREGAVRSDRESMLKDPRWNYNDIDKGFAEAAKTGKPLLVLIRCVPCKGCMGMDAEILKSKEVQPSLDKFVCVRIINANALDLTKFQFDYDLSLSTLFFNADGTLYGRFGSWQHQKDIRDNTLDGFKATLEAAAELHKGYPANKASLQGKQGGPAPFKTPVEIPALVGKFERELNWAGPVVKSCVHCHQIGDAFRSYYRTAGKPIPLDLIYPMPAPETVGFSLDADHITHVSDVKASSAAATAGLQKGDDIATVDGQPMISIADFAWCLHRAPESGALKLGVKRGAETKDLTLTLAPGWRTKSDISTRVGTWSMRGMAFGGLLLGSISDADREKRGIAKTEHGLLLKFVGAYGAHAAAKAAGFLKDDIILTVEGTSQPMTEGELIGHLLTTYPKPTKLKTTVLRGDKRIDLMLPVQ